MQTRTLTLVPIFDGDTIAEEQPNTQRVTTPPIAPFQPALLSLVTSGPAEWSVTPAVTPQPITGPTAAHMDRELDIKHDLLNLNRARDDNKVAMQALLYELHKLMVGTGRAGKFAAFLRNELGWTDKYAPTKASRWIAAHEFRAGLIDEETYNKRMGNGNATLRSDSSPSSDRPVAPAFQQEFTVEVDENVLALTPPTFTPEEIAADAQALASRKDNFYSAVLFRAYYPDVFHSWLRWAWKVQRQRYNVKTYAEVIAAISLCGLKPADADDDWGLGVDEILHDVGAKPALLLTPDFVHPEDREESPRAVPVSASHSPALAVGNPEVDIDLPVCWDQTLDDFDDAPFGL